MTDTLRNEFSRVFMLESRASPARTPSYQGLWKAGAVSWEQGDVTVTRIPDPNAYGQFVRTGKIIGEPGDPELTIMARATFDRSTLLRLARNGCDHDLQVHMGKCKNPQDFNRGWEKVLVLEAARITSYGTEDLGALGPDERAEVNEEVPFTGEDLYEVVPLNFSRKAEALVGREVSGLYVCDSVQCGTCGITSDGCQFVIAAVNTSGGSPGILAELVYTINGGSTWSERVISTLGAAENPNGVLCVGDYVVVFSEDSESLHYLALTDLKAVSGSWTEIATGFVATKGPLAAFSLGPTQTWLVAEGGYIYYSDDITAGVEVQEDGSNTTQDLLAIDGYDALNLVAVGASNAVLVTRNGGQSWQSVTGPAVGVNLNAVAMKSEDEWIIGTAGGRLFYTVDGGTNWTEKAFSGSGSGSVRAIKFTTRTVGYMAHSTTTPAGRVFRTIDGGNSWYILPEGTGSIPANDYISQLAVCDDPNILFAGGLADDASDGIVLKVA